MPLTGFDFHERRGTVRSSELAEAWRPYIETTIDAFGVQKCMFESNFPEDRRSSSYGRLWNAFKRIASTATSTEKDALFRRSEEHTSELQSLMRTSYAVFG